MAFSYFIKRIDSAVRLLDDYNAGSMIRIVSHLDCDGICSCAILIKALNNQGRKYSVSILPQLEERTIRQMSLEDYGFYIFSDLGSGNVNLIKKYFKEKNIIILDHHKPEKIKDVPNIIHVNPHLFGIDGSRELAGAGVAYLFAERIDNRNKDLSHIAIIGAIGDNMERDGFIGINDKILKTSVSTGDIKVSKGLRFFGTQTRPIHKVLQYCFDPYIPGVTGSESEARDFLKEIGIKYRQGTGYKKMSDLTDKEKKKLADGIIKRRKDEKVPDDVFGNIYTLPKQKHGPYRDAREFSTLLNACGRLGKASVGISALLGDMKMKKKAEGILSDYKYEIINALNWYRNNITGKNIISTRNYIIINSGYNIFPTMIGTIASILSNSNDVREGSVIIAMARTENKNTKISIRIAGKQQPSRVNAYELLSRIIKVTGGESGGHRNAAGGIISSTKEKQFISNAKQILKNIEMEEII